MPTSSPTNPGGSSPIPKKATKLSSSDWIGTSLLTTKTITAAAECAPFPYIKAVFGTVVVLLETVEKVKKNREDLKELCDDALEIIKIVRDQISAHGGTAAEKFKGLCEDLEKCLQAILDEIKTLQKKSKGFHSRFKEVIKLSSTTEQINGHRTRIQTLRLNFVLAATMDTNFQVHKLAVMAPNVPMPQVFQSINSCPPPSRIFQGRQIILKKMHEYFNEDPTKQQIFLLYGLGGAGKTQIALKFIEQSSCTPDTIDTGLKNIAVTKNVGKTSDDALKWLVTKQDKWLLFFDNADDPKINLNNHFPRCNHGNILITSRNPGLRGYAGSDYLVADMEEADAVELLLTSAKEEMSAENKKISAEIVKALGYLPLAIIQAGAFIIKSGALKSYLSLYVQNRERLLSEKPAQSHDDYAWTVYTTWQISFERLSQPASTLLQLCSFLHHQRISEQMFSQASKYLANPNGPSKEELEKPLELLSQFLGPTGVWDSLHFMDLTTELRAYSLINLDSETGLFSIHPLVHSWSQGTLSDQKVYHYSMVAIVGMSISCMQQEWKRVALGLLPHIDSLLQGETYVTPDFNTQYSRIYYHSGRFHRAVEIQIAMVEKYKTTLGEDHAHTLKTMGSLASTYHQLRQLKEAEELKVAVLEKQRKTLGEDHPETLWTMASLAATYNALGQLSEAEDLEVVVLERQKRICGEDHLDTLHTMGTLVSTYHLLGRLNEAERLAIVVLEKRKRILGEDHPDTLWIMGNLAGIYHKLGRLEEAEELQIIVLRKQRRIQGDHNRITLYMMKNLRAIQEKLGKSDEANLLRLLIEEIEGTEA
ncbi:hypothetical protein C8R44DRAFT_750881 [Mycena epipterygia]|nr:hypothetical protein C8R44DRAFT_750881 [Mycena epipterygia]